MLSLDEINHVYVNLISRKHHINIDTVIFDNYDFFLTKRYFNISSISWQWLFRIYDAIINVVSTRTQN